MNEAERATLLGLLGGDNSPIPGAPRHLSWARATFDLLAACEGLEPRGAKGSDLFPVAWWLSQDGPSKRKLHSQLDALLRDETEASALATVSSCICCVCTELLRHDKGRGVLDEFLSDPDHCSALQGMQAAHTTTNDVPAFRAALHGHEREQVMRTNIARFARGCRHHRPVAAAGASRTDGRAHSTGILLPPPPPPAGGGRGARRQQQTQARPPAGDSHGGSDCGGRQPIVPITPMVITGTPPTAGRGKDTESRHAHNGHSNSSSSHRGGHARSTGGGYSNAHGNDSSQQQHIRNGSAGTDPARGRVNDREARVLVTQPAHAPIRPTVVVGEKPTPPPPSMLTRVGQFTGLWGGSKQPEAVNVEAAASPNSMRESWQCAREECTGKNTQNGPTHTHCRKCAGPRPAKCA
jgi:hypothetical protein